MVGAGVGRTGTLSLKTALERLLDGPCYHGSVLFDLGRGRHLRFWRAAARGEPVDWAGFLDGYAAVVDWPASAFWEDIAATYPDAIVVLSTRDSPVAWHRSAHETIFRYARLAPINPIVRMFTEVLAARFTPRVLDPEEAMAAYERHNAHVRATVPPERLVEWRPGDGWEPLCAALGVPVPDEPFPETNTRADWDRLRGRRTPR
ncbi:sulfotransferase family protein [Nocardioides ultimimeridianus]